MKPSTNITKNCDSLCSMSSESSEVIKALGPREVVLLNIYGLTELNEKLRPHKLAIYHVGVQVHSVEWSYGYHQYQISGIYALNKPKDLHSLSNSENMFYFFDSIIIGETHFTPAQIVKYLTYLGSTEWTGLKYHLVYRNSIDFAQKLCSFLCDKSIPQWVNNFVIINHRHPEILTDVPNDFRTPLALREIIEHKVNYVLQCQQKLAKQPILRNQAGQAKENNEMPKTKMQTDSNEKESNSKQNEKCQFLSRFDSESLIDLVDSRILAAPSMVNFRQEIEQQKTIE